jgi:nucleotidyltransferase substrate binding protein (TIGR01987 family)
MIDLTSLQKAIAQLETAIDYTQSDLAKSDETVALLFRAAAIQAFEYTYELSVKMLRRYLEATEASPSAVQQYTYNELLRRAYALGLVQEELMVWKQFRTNRGTTSHGYDEDKAQVVFDAIPEFLAEAIYVYSQIENRQQAN